MPRLAVVVVVAGLSAACSADTARLSENPFSNPFSTGSARMAEPTTTGSLPQSPAMPTAAMQSSALPPLPAAAATAPVSRAAATAPTVSRAAVASAGGPAGWTSVGGTPVTVGAGDGLSQLATRYGVPASAILSANGLTSASQVTAGRQLVIPVYNATSGQTSASAPVAPRAVTPPAPVRTQASAPARTSAPAQPTMRLVEGGKPAATGQRVRPGQQAAKADTRPPAPVKAPAAAPVASRPEAVKPQPAKPVAAAAATKANPVTIQPKQQAQAAAPVTQPTRVASVGAAPIGTALAKPAPAAPAEPVSLPQQPESSGAEFRWPARGRVISGFGTNGNEGINIAVPEGTPVKAAEGGVVAYAGSELKGYGNLVLIRHENGYVSAYAHNGEIAVKRGEKVKRGQTIAKSGQTGNVNSPQLHFEVRKGSTPVDPVPYLSGN